MVSEQEQAIIIVGCGQAGLQAAVSLREDGHNGPITMIGEEGGLPYQRPPLSKAFLLGKMPATGLNLRGAAFLAAQRILLLDCDPVVAIDRVRRIVTLSSGTSLSYVHLVLATGARRRELNVPGAELAGIHYLRTRTDAEALKAALPHARHTLVIGAGFIGLEFAAVAAELGIKCSIIEAAPVLLGRAVSRTMAECILRNHEARGTRFLFGEMVGRFEPGADGHVARAVTVGGEEITADLVIVGIGVIANDRLAAQAGLEVDGGILVDDSLHTSDPAISAVGDCAVAPHPLVGTRIRIESVQNAIDQGRHLAKVLTVGPKSYTAVPWFWSDQGTMKLQISGLTVGHDIAVPRGDPTSGQFSVFCYRGEVLAGVESLNRPTDHMAARRFVGTPFAPTRSEASDESLDLRSFVPA